MKIIIVGDFVHEMYERALYNAFKELGEEVIAFELYKCSGNNTFSRFIRKIQSRLLFGPIILKLNSDLISQVREQKPDLIFLYRTPQIYANTVIEVKKLGAKVFSYNNDDPFSGIPTLRFWRHYQQAAKFCDHNFVYRKKNILDFKSIDVENVSVLRSYYIKENNFPIDCEKKYDVIFIGHYENDGRDKYIKALIDAGISITVFGDKLWEKSSIYTQIKSVIRASKRGREYNETLNRAKIALVFLSKINADTYTRRCFEIPAAKTLMLSEYTDDLNSMFVADKEAVYFSHPEELVNKCRYLLNNRELISEISDNGYRKLIQSGHEVTDRAKEIMKIYNAQ